MRGASVREQGVDAIAAHQPVVAGFALETIITGFAAQGVEVHHDVEGDGDVGGVEVDRPVLLPRAEDPGGERVGAAGVHQRVVVPGPDRCRAAADLAAPDADFIVNLQGDAPFTPPEHVAALIDNAAKGDVVTPVIQLSWSALDALREHKKTTPFSGTTCIRGPDGRALWFSKIILPAMRNETKLRGTGDLSPVLQHVGLYGYSRTALDCIASLKLSRYEELEGLEQLRFLENGLSVFAVPVAPSQLPSAGIDTPEDAERATRVLQQFGDPYRS